MFLSKELDTIFLFGKYVHFHDKMFSFGPQRLHYFSIFIIFIIVSSYLLYSTILVFTFEIKIRHWYFDPSFKESKTKNEIERLSQNWKSRRRKDCIFTSYNKTNVSFKKKTFPTCHRQLLKLWQKRSITNDHRFSAEPLILW